MSTMTRQDLLKLFTECSYLYASRADNWGETFDEMSEVLAAMNPEVHATESTASWCADMACLKLKRFYKSGCTSEDSLMDAINYLGMAFWSVKRSKNALNTLSCEGEREAYIKHNDEVPDQIKAGLEKMQEKLHLQPEKPKEDEDCRQAWIDDFADQITQDARDEEEYQKQAAKHVYDDITVW